MNPLNDDPDWKVAYDIFWNRLIWKLEWERVLTWFSFVQMIDALTVVEKVLEIEEEIKGGAPKTIPLWAVPDDIEGMSEHDH